MLSGVSWALAQASCLKCNRHWTDQRNVKWACRWHFEVRTSVCLQDFVLTALQWRSTSRKKVSSTWTNHDWVSAALRLAAAQTTSRSLQGHTTAPACRPARWKWAEFLPACRTTTWRCTSRARSARVAAKWRSLTTARLKARLPSLSSTTPVSLVANHSVIPLITIPEMHHNNVSLWVNTNTYSMLGKFAYVWDCLVILLLSFSC